MAAPKAYWLSRFVFQRGLGVVYLIAFLVAVNQFRPLAGERGLLPAGLYLKHVPFRDAPSLFFLFPNDMAFVIAAWLGVLLSILAVAGLSERFGTWFSVLVWSLLWVLYLSFVNAGQIFYAFGWESILLETGFFAIFLGANKTTPPWIMILILRWVLFRVMFGAGLIKLRGDPCWRDLTCLNYHYETQPMPNPLSWYFHWAPEWTRRGGVLFNHFVEVIVPFAYFIPQPVSAIAGLVTIAFQALLMLSGNLSWLNLLTIVLAIPTLDDRFLRALVPVKTPETQAPHRIYKLAIAAVAVLVAILSIPPVLNMVSPDQIMNYNYNPLHLVNTYGAFGGITRPRYEVIVEGTAEPVLTSSTVWRAYEFKGKPGDPGRRPPQIAPYHLRLDWLMWFAAMSSYNDHPWFVHFLAKLLEGDRATLGLLLTNPFPDHPPRYVRAQLYEYHFTSSEERNKTGHWWKRQFVSDYFPPVSLENPAFRALLEQQRWM
jgi:lipase maturation factor